MGRSSGGRWVKCHLRLGSPRAHAWGKYPGYMASILIGQTEMLCPFVLWFSILCQAPALKPERPPRELGDLAGPVMG